MATDMKRFTLTVTPETVQYLDELKQKEFYDKPYSAMYRYIIDMGIKCIQSGGGKQRREA
ncbi:MAG: hypothetical protein FWF06_06355 [Symbiobacteriaceae bacterium]|nr:hypothetical protein [Symbiobacteriaceae bacterium]